MSDGMKARPLKGSTPRKWTIIFAFITFFDYNYLIDKAESAGQYCTLTTENKSFYREV